MSAMYLVLLVAAELAAALGAAALFTARGVHRQLIALRAELSAARVGGVGVPAARSVPSEEIRAAVAGALADERERELAEARAFWAAQEAREAADAPLYGTGGLTGSDFEVLPYLPRQPDLAGLEPDPGVFRHPSDPDFAVPSPVVADQEQTAERLANLADARIPLADVRPGPLGTLDVYVFADGTTLCMTPGHRETALQLADALDRGEIPVLLGGSGIAGAFALTFTYGDESVFILADRVVASL